MSQPQLNQYSNTQLFKTITINAGQTTSNLIDCAALLNSIGALTTGAFRMLAFPSNWTPADIQFTLFQDALGTIPLGLLNITDTTITAPLNIPDCPISGTVDLYPFWMDAVTYFKIISSVTQVNTVNIIGIFQPIYQGTK